MELSLLLAQQILAQFLMLLAGFALVRLRVAREEDATALSVVTMYVVFPCVALSAFQIDYTPAVARGLGLAFAGAGAVNALFILLPYLLRRRFRLDAVEQASLSYPNCGNLIVPLVAATLGADQQIYSCAYIVIQTALLFTHGLSLIRGERRPDLKGALRNPNILAILLGAALFALHVRFPAPLAAAVNGFAGMVAPASMLVIGMAIGRADLRRIFTSRRVYAVTFLRLLALPALAVLLLRLTGLARLLPEGRDILRVVVMAASASPATTLTQMAQCYGGNAAEASALNVMGVVFLIVTMPLLLLFYQALI